MAVLTLLICISREVLVDGCRTDPFGILICLLHTEIRDILGTYPAYIICSGPEAEPSQYEYIQLEDSYDRIVENIEQQYKRQEIQSI